MVTTFTRIAPVLPVRSVRRALDHYRKLGFGTRAYEAEAEPGEPIYGYLEWGPVTLHLTRFAELDPLANTSACYVYVEDTDALHAAWQAAGVGGRLIAPEDTEYGLREMAHIDPDGNLLRLGSPLPPR